MTKRIFMSLCFSLMLSGCTGAGNENAMPDEREPEVFRVAEVIELSDELIKVNGEEISRDSDSAVYLANDIVYYEEGKDFTYGEGNETDAHSKEEAEKHSVVHITKAGAYAVSGRLSNGQIAIDLGEGAEDDPNAAVTLILNGVDITCTVAPAVIFYNVYECGNDDEESASAVVDTSNAGANVIIADGTVNYVNGSYVARIYKSDTVELNEDKTEVLEAKKLHKYDAAFYSKRSLNINQDIDGTGVLRIKAENEGLDSELHLTINGGNIYIESGNDGINTNEDNVSVTTINGGLVNIAVNGSTGEGDGIDSNGWLVINGGTVITSACGFSADSGIDSDKGILINGGTVIASGNMLDHISESRQNYAVFSFAVNQTADQTYRLIDASGTSVLEFEPAQNFSVLLVSSEQLKNGRYTLWQDEIQLRGVKDLIHGFGSGMMPERMSRPEGHRPEDKDFPAGYPNESFGWNEGGIPEKPEEDLSGHMEGKQQGRNLQNMEAGKEFVMEGIENFFSFVQTSE